MSYLFDCFFRSIARGPGINKYFEISRHKILQRFSVGIFILLFLPFAAYALAMGEIHSDSAWKYVGWACDSSAPGYQAVVEARRDDGVMLGRVVADRNSVTAISRDCASPHEFHGFELYVERKPEWVDGKVHEVIVYAIDQEEMPTRLNSFFVEFSGISVDVQSPKNAGDIVGRDLNYGQLGWLGHIGIWDGSHVIEVLNDNGSNKVFKNTWDNFKSRSSVWDTVTPRYPAHTIRTCWAYECDVNSNYSGGIKVSPAQAVVYRASQVQMIGSDYTVTVAFTTAEPAMIDYKQPGWKRKSLRGTYRCDTFVYDAFRASTDLDNSGVFPYREVYGMDGSWRRKVSGLYGFSVMLPTKVIEKIKSF
jgi:hypothetical protein